MSYTDNRLTAALFALMAATAAATATAAAAEDNSVETSDSQKQKKDCGCIPTEVTLGLIFIGILIQVIIVTCHNPECAENQEWFLKGMAGGFCDATRSGIEGFCNEMGRSLWSAFKHLGGTGVNQKSEALLNNETKNVNAPPV